MHPPTGHSIHLNILGWHNSGLNSFNQEFTFVFSFNTFKNQEIKEFYWEKKMDYFSMFITKTEKYNQYLEIIPSSDVLIGWHWTFVDCDILSLWCQGMVFPQAKLGTRGREEEKKTKHSNGIHVKTFFLCQNFWVIFKLIVIMFQSSCRLTFSDVYRPN